MPVRHHPGVLVTPASKKPAILICDDERGTRESLKLILKDRYELSFAENGVEALSMLTAGAAPDLLLLDIKMPKIHGLEILKKIKAEKPKLPVMIVSGYQSTEIAKEALKAGACDYVPKPFESKTILSAVLSALS